MALDSEAYRDLLKSLIPVGAAFPRDDDTEMHKLLHGMADELARLDARAVDLLREVLPSETIELLTDWERVAGLPDRCNGSLELTLQGRRNVLLSKLASTGGQSPQYFIDVAASLGFVVTIEEYRPFRAGMSTAGDSLTNGDWIYTWTVHAPEETIISFRAGKSRAGEPLRDWGNELLECKINGLKPAHTLVLFAYG